MSETNNHSNNPIDTGRVSCKSKAPGVCVLAMMKLSMAMAMMMTEAIRMLLIMKTMMVLMMVVNEQGQ